MIAAVAIRLLQDMSTSSSENQAWLGPIMEHVKVALILMDLHAWKVHRFGDSPIEQQLNIQPAIDGINLAAFGGPGASASCDIDATPME